MWAGRPAALRPLLEEEFVYHDFRDRSRERVPDLQRLLERLISAAAGEDGYHVRTVLDPEHASLTHLAVEYKIDQLAVNLPGYPVEQIQFLHRAGWMGIAGAVAFFRMHMKTNHNGVVERLDPVMRPFGRGARVRSCARRGPARRRVADWREGAARERFASLTPGGVPEGGRRLVVYTIYDRRGGIDDYVVHALEGLRPHSARIVAVVNGDLTPSGRARLEPVVDEVIVRENSGFDIGAQRHALHHLREELSRYDEIVLTNDTWFGPVRPSGPSSSG